MIGCLKICCLRLRIGRSGLGVRLRKGWRNEGRSRMGGRFGGPFKAPRRWDSEGKEIYRVLVREKALLRIPVCPRCGVRCTVCHSLKTGQAFADQPKQCCLILAGKPE